MGWLEDLVTVLEDAGVGTYETDIFCTTKAAIPILVSGEATITLVETPGAQAERTQNSVVRPAYLMPSAQVMCRSTDVEKAREKAWRCHTALAQIRNVFINSGWYREINPRQPPFDAGVDDRKQARYGFNVIAIKRPEEVQ